MSLWQWKCPRCLSKWKKLALLFKFYKVIPFNFNTNAPGPIEREIITIFYVLMDFIKVINGFMLQRYYYKYHPYYLFSQVCCLESKLVSQFKKRLGFKLNKDESRSQNSIQRAMKNWHNKHFDDW